MCESNICFHSVNATGMDFHIKLQNVLCQNQASAIYVYKITIMKSQTIFEHIDILQIKS